MYTLLIFAFSSLMILDWCHFLCARRLLGSLAWAAAPGRWAVNHWLGQVSQMQAFAVCLLSVHPTPPFSPVLLFQGAFFPPQVIFLDVNQQIPSPVILVILWGVLLKCQDAKII